MILQPGSAVSNSRGGISMLGPMVYSEGAWYAFVPRHKFDGDNEVRQAGTGLLIGEVVSTLREVEDRVDDRKDLAAAMRLVRLYSYAPMSVGRHGRVECVDAVDLLGETVLKRGGMASVPCEIVSADGPFYMAAPGGRRDYFGAFGLQAQDPQQVLAKDGDAGASIVTRDGKLVGVLVGEADGTCYCASGSALMARFFPGFELPEMIA